MKTLLLSAAFAAVAAGVSAQDIYAGGAIDYAVPHSGDQSVGLTLLGGAQFGNGGGLSFGPEADLNITSDGEYKALHVRGVVRHDTGTIALMASAGYTNFDIDTGGNADGLNYGLGMDYEVGAGTNLRFEMIRDHMSGYSTDVTTFRLGATYGF